MRDSWEEPVTVMYRGDNREIGSTMDAADCVFSSCRGESGPIYDSAMQCFAEVFDERQSPATARDAIVELIESSPSIAIVSVMETRRH